MVKKFIFLYAVSFNAFLQQLVCRSSEASSVKFNARETSLPNSQALSQHDRDMLKGVFVLNSHTKEDWICWYKKKGVRSLRGLDWERLAMESQKKVMFFGVWISKNRAYINIYIIYMITIKTQK